MKTRNIDTITNNEDHIRLKIYDGDLNIDEAGQELLRLTKTQLRIERVRSLKYRRELEKIYVEFLE